MVVREWGEFVYAPPDANRGDVITLPAEEAHHLFRVRRIAPEAEVFVTDGAGMVFRCQTRVGNVVDVVESLPEFGEPPQPITLCMAALKGDANRDVVDTAAQLGATEIRFFPAARSEGKLKVEKLEEAPACSNHGDQTVRTRAAATDCGVGFTRLRAGRFACGVIAIAGPSVEWTGWDGINAREPAVGVDCRPGGRTDRGRSD